MNSLLWFVAWLLSLQDANQVSALSFVCWMAWVLSVSK